MDRIKTGLIIVSVVVVFALIAIFIRNDFADRDRAREEFVRDGMMKFYAAGAGVSFYEPSGKYKSTADIYKDAVRWTERFENDRVTAAELRSAIDNLRLEAVYFSDDDLSDALLAVYSATFRLSDRTKLLNAIDDLRRLEID